MTNKKQKTIGSRAEVFHGTALKTSGGLTKDKLMKNKHGRIVSIKKHEAGKRFIKANPDFANNLKPKGKKKEKTLLVKQAPPKQDKPIPVLKTGAPAKRGRVRKRRARGSLAPLVTPLKA